MKNTFLFNSGQTGPTTAAPTAAAALPQPTARCASSGKGSKMLPPLYPHLRARRAAVKTSTLSIVAVAAVFAVLLGLLFLAPDVKEAPAATAKGTAERRVFRVSLGAWTALAQEKGWFKEVFEPLNTDIEVVNRLASGGAEAALFMRGEIHIGERMAYPSLQHKANGFDFVIVWAGGPCHPRRATTVVRKGSTVHKLADLKGKVLGAHRLGCPYLSTYEALLDVGLQLDTELKKGDVRYTNITGQPAILALLNGEIEALATHPSVPDIGKLYLDGHIREVGFSVKHGEYASNGGRALIVTTRRFADENPDLIQAYLRLYNRAREYIVDGDHYDEAADYLSKHYRIPKDVALFTIRDESSLSLSAGGFTAKQTGDALKSFLRWAIANGDDFYTTKPLTDAQVDEFIDTRFFEGGQFYVETTGGKQPANAPARDGSGPANHDHHAHEHHNHGGTPASPVIAPAPATPAGETPVPAVNHDHHNHGPAPSAK
jgi:sulfonate transport system substrate-binding protein